MPLQPQRDMNLSTTQQAALVGALAHPANVISAPSKTAAALRRRGLVSQKNRLTAKGKTVAGGIGTGFARCCTCGELFPALYTLPVDRVVCPTCIRSWMDDAPGDRTWTNQIAEDHRRRNVRREINQHRLGGNMRPGIVI